MKLNLVLLLACLCTAPVQAEIYKWVDADGKVHYGDEPAGAGAQRMQSLPELTTYDALPANKPKALPYTGAQAKPAPTAKTPKVVATQYQEISIVKPEQEETVRDNSGNLTIFVAVAPVLAKEDYLKVILDGSELAEQHHSTVINITGVERGEHQVAVAVYDAAGNQLLLSDAHKIFMHQAISNKTSRNTKNPEDYDPPDDTVTEQIDNKDTKHEDDPYYVDEAVPYFKNSAYPNPNFPTQGVVTAK